MNILRPTWFGRWRARRNLRNVYAKQDAGLKANVNIYNSLDAKAQAVVDRINAKKVYSTDDVLDKEYAHHLVRILKKQKEAEARVGER